jgi:hypothetical protein
MKRKRPLITKHDIRKLVAQARKTTGTLNEPVQVQPLLRSFYPERKITNQMRRIVSVALDKAGIDRAKRAETPMPKSLTSRKTIEREGPVIDVQEYPVQNIPSLIAEAADQSIPGVLGGVKADDSDVIDVSLPDDIQAECERYAARLERIVEIDRELSKMADDGNYAALNLLFHRLRTR